MRKFMTNLKERKMLAKFRVIFKEEEIKRGKDKGRTT